MLVPPDYVGAVMDLTVGTTVGTFMHDELPESTTTVEMLWEIPLSELIMDYFDQLKSRTQRLRERWTTSSDGYQA